MAFGTEATYTRHISYAMGGRPLLATRVMENSEPDIDALRRITSTVLGTSLLLTAICLVLLSVGSAMASHRLINQLDQPTVGWAMLVLVVLSASAAVWGQAHMAYLMGTGRILSLRRWEFVTGVASAASVLAVVLLDGGLLPLISVVCFWWWVGLLRNAWMARRFDVQGSFGSARPAFDRDVLSLAWPAQWRLGVSTLFSQGAIQISGLAAAQFLAAPALASYLFHLRLIQLVNGFSLPPFYNRIPEFARLYSMGRFDGIRELAKRRMRLSYWAFTMSFMCVGLGTDWFITNYTTQGYSFFPALWGAFGVAFFLERMAGMHGQLTMLSNRVPYYLNIGAGVVYLALSPIVVGQLGNVAFPVSYAVGLAIAYTPFAIVMSQRVIQFPYLSFLAATAGLPALVLLFYAALIL